MAEISETAQRYLDTRTSGEVKADDDAQHDALLAVLERIAAALEKIAERRT